MSFNSKSLEEEVMEQFDSNHRAYGNEAGYGEIEIMRLRIEKLENAVAHLMDFISDKLRLTPKEIADENGLTDF